MADVLKVIQDFNDDEYYKAGHEFGEILTIALNGYLANSTDISLPVPKK